MLGATSPAPLMAWSALGKLALWAWMARSQWLSAYLTSISDRPQDGQRTFSRPSELPPAPQNRSVAVSTPTPEQVGQVRVLSRTPGVSASKLIWSIERVMGWWVSWSSPWCGDVRAHRPEGGGMLLREGAPRRLGTRAGGEPGRQRRLGGYGATAGPSSE